MRLVVGAPVAGRAWSLPTWFACLAGQTRRPDAVAFIHSGRVGDPTWEACIREAARHEFSPVMLHHDPAPPHRRHDNERYRTLARLRNRLLDSARDELGADLFLSLDTDIMLENPETVERLEHLVVHGGYDVAGPVTFLHPEAPRSWSPAELPCWAYNFGWLQPPDGLCDRTTWRRPPVTDIPWGSKVTHSIPMAAWLATRRVLDCRYRWHESGEDIGFAISLQEADARCVTDTGLYAPHIWADVDLRHRELEASL
jgi:hypothetical protein